MRAQIVAIIVVPHGGVLEVGTSTGANRATTGGLPPSLVTATQPQVRSSTQATQDVAIDAAGAPSVSFFQRCEEDPSVTKDVPTTNLVGILEFCS